MKMNVKQSGFSLVEVALAIFLVAMGLLSLFSLFPAGLSQAESARADTHESLFSDYILATLAGESQSFTSNQWDRVSEFANIIEGLTGSDALGSVVSTEFPTGSDVYMRYICEIASSGDSLRRVSLWCRSGEFGTTDPATFKPSASQYYTELVFMKRP